MAKEAVLMSETLHGDLIFEAILTMGVRLSVGPFCSVALHSAILQLVNQISGTPISSVCEASRSLDWLREG